MGCAHSTRASPRSSFVPPRAVAPDLLASNVNRSRSASIPIIPTQDGSGSRPNAPLQRPPQVTSANAPRTRSALETERAIFFDTRVTGRPEVWAALRIAIELLRDEHDYATAQGVLDAAGVTVPRGRLEEGMFDQQGQLYRVEDWILSDPIGLTEDQVDDDDEDDHRTSSPVDDKHASATARTQIQEQTISAGKVNVRVRLSDPGAKDLTVSLEMNEDMKTLATLIRKQANIPTEAKIKLVYLGKMLRDGVPLTDTGWREGHCISALISR